VGAVERLWYDRSSVSRVVRGALAPASWLYGAVARARGELYDRDLLTVHQAALPVLSIGNLSVGGTGKTPVSAWAAALLRGAGARPAIVLRGYGADEPLVHARLNPGVTVIADADRVRGVSRAKAEGADCAILDDAFQHRRISRQADWVLVAAEQWRDDLRLLPAGPLREPLSALQRASLVMVTRKTATPDMAEALAERLARRLERPLSAVVHLAPSGVVNALTGASLPMSWLGGRRLVAVAAVGAPELFFAQLRASGVEIGAPVAYRDHHAFSSDDVSRLLQRAEGAEGVVCTLKDVVKLGPLWPRVAPPLLYVSQHAVLECGRTAVDASLAEVLAARAGDSQTAGPAGQSTPAHGHRSSTADR
jgi:tetraacyldisaccharide 4'-kinase